MAEGTRTPERGEARRGSGRHGRQPGRELGQRSHDGGRRGAGRACRRHGPAGGRRRPAPAAATLRARRASRPTAPGAVDRRRASRSRSRRTGSARSSTATIRMAACFRASGCEGLHHRPGARVPRGQLRRPARAPLRRPACSTRRPPRPPSARRSGLGPPEPPRERPAPQARATRSLTLIDRPTPCSPPSCSASRCPNPVQPDYVALQVTDGLLGGTFGSRITTNIRERKGYSYAPFSTVTDFYRQSYWAEQADVTTKRDGQLAQGDLRRDRAAPVRGCPRRRSWPGSRRTWRASSRCRTAAARGSWGGSSSRTSRACRTRT